MQEREKEFRQRIARIQRIQNLNERYNQNEKEEIGEYKDFSEIMPAICGVKKSIENFRNITKEIVNEER